MQGAFRDGLVTYNLLRLYDKKIVLANGVGAAAAGKYPFPLGDVMD